MYKIITPRTRLNIETGAIERQCIGPKLSKLTLCSSSRGINNDGWMVESLDNFATRKVKSKKNGQVIYRVISQPRCKDCDHNRGRVSKGHDVRSELSRKDLMAMTDEAVAVVAQTYAGSRNDAFSVLLDRTKALRYKLAKSAAYSKGYSVEDTLANSMMGLLKAIDSYQRDYKSNLTGLGVKWRTHAYNWIFKHSSNRSLCDQPLHDQYRRVEGGKRDANGDKITRKRAIHISTVPAHSSSDDDESGRTFDGVVGGRESNDDLSSDLYDRLITLDPQTLEIVLRKFFRNETISEISNHVGVSKTTVSNRLKSGISQLREDMAGY